MHNLKPYFDAARAAEEKVQEVVAKIDEHFNEGTDEGKKAALELRSALDEAKQAANEANELYLSMREATASNEEAAKEFVPASKTSSVESAQNEMSREDFFALDAATQMAFIKDGGVVREDEE